MNGIRLALFQTVQSPLASYSGLPTHANPKSYIATYLSLLPFLPLNIQPPILPLFHNPTAPLPICLCLHSPLSLPLPPTASPPSSSPSPYLPLLLLPLPPLPSLTTLVSLLQCPLDGQQSSLSLVQVLRLDPVLRDSQDLTQLPTGLLPHIVHQPSHLRGDGEPRAAAANLCHQLDGGKRRCTL